jgi:hypothetical protein
MAIVVNLEVFFMNTFSKILFYGLFPILIHSSPYEVFVSPSGDNSNSGMKIIRLQHYIMHLIKL